MPEDRIDAVAFFYSDEAEFVHWRGVWFHLAGIELPPAKEMKAMVARLSSVHGKVRRDFS